MSDRKHHHCFVSITYLWILVDHNGGRRAWSGEGWQWCLWLWLYRNIHTIINYTLNNWYIVVTVWLMLHFIICSYHSNLYSCCAWSNFFSFFFLLRVIYINAFKTCTCIYTHVYYIWALCTKTFLVVCMGTHKKHPLANICFTSCGTLVHLLHVHVRVLLLKTFAVWCVHFTHSCCPTHLPHCCVRIWL